MSPSQQPQLPSQISSSFETDFWHSNNACERWVVGCGKDFALVLHGSQRWQSEFYGCLKLFKHFICFYFYFTSISWKLLMFSFAHIEFILSLCHVLLFSPQPQCHRSGLPPHVTDEKMLVRWGDLWVSWNVLNVLARPQRQNRDNILTTCLGWMQRRWSSCDINIINSKGQHKIKHQKVQTGISPKTGPTFFSVTWGKDRQIGKAIGQQNRS